MIVNTVDYSKVKKDIKNLPRLVFDKFLKWVKDIEDTDIGWSEVTKLSTYRDHLLKGHSKGRLVSEDLIELSTKFINLVKYVLLKWRK